MVYLLFKKLLCLLEQLFVSVHIFGTLPKFVGVNLFVFLISLLASGHSGAFLFILFFKNTAPWRAAYSDQGPCPAASARKSLVLFILAVLGLRYFARVLAAASGYSSGAPLSRCGLLLSRHRLKMAVRLVPQRHVGSFSLKDQTYISFINFGDFFFF